MTPGFRFDSVIGANELLEDNTVASGDITLEDVYRFFPVVYTLSTANVTGQRVKESGRTLCLCNQCGPDNGGISSNDKIRELGPVCYLDRLYLKVSQYLIAYMTRNQVFFTYTRVAVPA